MRRNHPLAHIWQSKETEKLIKRNDRLMGENAALRRDLSLQKDTQEEFARKVSLPWTTYACNHRMLTFLP